MRSTITASTFKSFSLDVEHANSTYNMRLCVLFYRFAAFELTAKKNLDKKYFRL